MFRDVLLVDSESGLASSMSDCDRRVCGTPFVIAMRHPHFIKTRTWKVGAIGHGFLAFARLLIVQIADANMRWCVS